MEEQLQAQTQSPKVKNIVIILLVFLTIVVIGVVAYVFKTQKSSNNVNTKAAITKNINVYFEPVSGPVTNGTVETNVFLETTPGDKVSGATVSIKTQGMTLDKAKTSDSTTQANSQCRSNNFKLDNVINTQSDEASGTAEITKVSLQSDDKLPSGKFCFGTLTFNVAGSSATVSLNQDTSKFEIVGGSNDSSGNAVSVSYTPVLVSGKNIFTASNSNPTTTSTPVATATSTPSATTTSTPNPTITTTSTPISTTTITPRQTTTSTPASTTLTSTPLALPSTGSSTTPSDNGLGKTPDSTTPTGTLPDTDATPVNTVAVGLFGATLLVIAVLFLRRRYN